MAVCPVCLGEAFTPLAGIDFGGWETGADGGLRRWTEIFDLGRCAACAHVMITTPYDDDAFRRIYHDTPQDPVYWGDGLAGSAAPYADMAAFCGALPESGLLVDVGCGPGLLLDELHRERGVALDRLLGVDFNRRLPEPYPFLRADLNRLAPEGLPDGIALAFASHLLEHLVDPRGFLRALGSRLADGGLVYVEVPDALHADPALVGPVNLINQQHIHYFCEESLARLAEGCGFRVVRRERSVLGAMPRLRMLLARAPDPGTAGAVGRALDLLAARRAALAAAVRAELGKGGAAGLWGVGADFHRLVAEHADVRERIAAGRVALFDLGLAGKTFAGQVIRPPSEVAVFEGVVFLAPLLGDVRRKMRRFAESAGVPPGRVVDPWAGGAG